MAGARPPADDSIDFLVVRRVGTGRPRRDPDAALQPGAVRGRRRATPYPRWPRPWPAPTCRASSARPTMPARSPSTGARRRGGRRSSTMRERIFRLSAVRPPARPPAGRLRLAGPEDRGLVIDWYAAFAPRGAPAEHAADHGPSSSTGGSPWAGCSCGTTRRPGVADGRRLADAARRAGRARSTRRPSCAAVATPPPASRAPARPSSMPDSRSCSCSPTWPTRPRTTSTRRSATSRSATSTPGGSTATRDADATWVGHDPGSNDRDGSMGVTPMIEGSGRNHPGPQGSEHRGAAVPPLSRRGRPARHRRGRARCPGRRRP